MFLAVTKHLEQNTLIAIKVTPWALNRKYKYYFFKTTFESRPEYDKAFNIYHPYQAIMWSCFLQQRDTVKPLATQLSCLVWNCWPRSLKPTEGFIPQPWCTEKSLIPNRSCWHWNYSCRFSASTNLHRSFFKSLIYAF